MKDVMIYDERSSETPVTYAAHEGQISSKDGRTSFTLYNGNMHLIKKNGMMDVTDFDSNTYDLTEILAVDPVLRLKTSDRYLYELFRPDPGDYNFLRYQNKYKAEGHARLAAPLYNIALVLLALAFLIRGEHQKLGYGRRIAIAAALGFTLRLAGFAIASAAEGDPALNTVQYAIPIIASLLAAWYLLHKRRARTIFRIPFKGART